MNYSNLKCVLILAIPASALRMNHEISDSSDNIMDKLFGQYTKGCIEELSKGSKPFCESETYALSMKRLMPADQASYDHAAKPHGDNDLGYDRCVASGRELRRHVIDNVNLAAFPPRKGIVHMNLKAPRMKKDLEPFLKKARLPVFSFFATQDLNKLELWIWLSELDQDKVKATVLPFQDVIPPRTFRLLTLDSNVSKQLIKKIPDLEESAQKGIIKLIDNQFKLKHTSDITDINRLLILAAHPGLYIDTDMVFIRDIWPLATGDDNWIYQGQQDFMNNAIIKNGHEGDFAKSALQVASTMKLQPTKLWQYGPRLLTKLWYEKGLDQNNKSFHMLPACFFDGAWVRRAAAPKWDNFFSGEASEENIVYLTDSSEKNPEPFMYHWHGRWNAQIDPSSVASKLESIYLDRLKRKWGSENIFNRSGV